MLNIYKTNKIELISEVLAKELIINPPFITENLKISIQNYFLSKWIKDQITLKNDINALCEFQTITEYTEELVRNSCEDQKIKSWNFESIKWSIVESFEELGQFKESWPLINWINKFIKNKKILDSEIYALILRITKVFSDYILYRPEMIEKWHNTELKNSHLFSGLNKDQYWQPILFKLIERNLNKPICIFMREIINDINNLKNSSKIKIPKNIYIVASNNLSKLHISFYSKLSEITNVNIYLLSPGYDMWNRMNIEDGKIFLNNNNKKQYLLNESIESIFCKFIANFEKLMEETILNEEIKVNIQLPFIDPTIKLKKINDSLLLNIIQKNLVNNNKQKLKIKNDDSISFKGCKNILIELNYIKNKIINICNSNKDINYSDILVVTNQINNLKPYLKFIFNSNERIPFFLSMQNYKDVSPIYKLLKIFIEIANKKISIDEIRELLSEDTLQSIYNFNNSEKEEILSYLTDAGFHWGINKKERLGEYKNSLEWCIQRFTLGQIYSEDFFINNSDIYSYSPSNPSLDINKWILILNEIIKIIKSLRTANSFRNWISILKNIFKKNEIKDYNVNEDLNNLYKILHDKSEIIDSEVIIDLNVLNELLNTYINNQTSNLDRRRNEVLISNIENAKLLPHKIIFLMGMNQIIYPKAIDRDSINILNNEYRFGDPSPIDKEKYLFIELLLSCREKFIISWSNYDFDNNALEISSPIRKLITVLRNQMDTKHQDNLITDIEMNKNDFKMISDRSFDPNEGLVSSLKFKNENFQNKKYKLSELINWFKSPQLYWLRQRNIFPKKKFNHNPSDEKISNYEKYKLLNNLLSDIDIDDPDYKIKLNKLNVKEKIISNGIISPKNSIYLNEAEIYKLIQSLIYNFKDLNNIRRKYQKSDSNKVEYFRCDNKIIELIHSNINFQKRSETWIKLLFISTLDKDINKAQIIYRKNNLYNVEILNAPCKIDSIKLLDKYLNIYHNSLEYCLPLPPESSYKYIFSLIKNKNHNKAFIDEWIGSKNFNLGERNKPEMQLCYGYEKDPNFFLNNENFQELSLTLFEPLLTSIL